jgi:hypothetical protein
MVAPRAFPNWVGLRIPPFNARLIHFFRIFLHSHDITFKLLRKSASYFGYNPRQCFDLSYSESRLNAEIEEVVARIRDIARGTTSMLQALYSYRLSANAISHTIFQLYPSNESRELAMCKYEVVSRWVLDSLLRVCETHEADAAAKFYCSLSGVPWAGAFLGQLFERQALKHLDDIGRHRRLTIRRLSDSGQIPWTYHGPIPRFVFEETTVISKIASAVAANESVHLVPSATNFPAVDSIIYYPNDVLTCIQTTINDDHPIAVSGVFKVGSNHRWEISALKKKKEVDGVSYLLCRKIWRLLSDCKISKVILTRTNGLERWTNMCLG